MTTLSKLAITALATTFAVTLSAAPDLTVDVQEADSGKTQTLGYDNEHRHWQVHSGTQWQSVLPANYPVESLCSVDNNVFASTGEGSIYHYVWHQSELHLYRLVPVNLDVETCQIIADQLVFLDELNGYWSTDYDPEGQVALKFHGTELPQFTSTPQSQTSSVTPNLETQPVGDIGDVADDPAIWIHPTQPELSLIIGTDKARGLVTYRLDGSEFQRLDVGRSNNVDLIQFQTTTLVTASNRTRRTLDVYSIDPISRQLNLKHQAPLDLDDPYGLCMGLVGETPVSFVGGKDGTLEWWDVSGTPTRRHVTQLPSQTEGCAYDAASEQLYIGEEESGIWRFDLSRGGFDNPKLFTFDELEPDIEGMAIYVNGTDRWLVASSQGDNHYLLLSLPDLTVQAKFQVTANYALGIDAVSETDGLDVTHRALPGFPEGLLVVQDGRNRMPDENQNFKLVDWRKVSQLQKTMPITD